MALVVAVVCIGALATCANPGLRRQPATGKLPYLDAEGSVIRTTHALRYRLSLPENFRATAVDSRRDVFNGHPFDISLAALLSANAAVMVHAETVADGSGASNYDDLPLAALGGLPFHKRPASCQDLSPEDIAGEHDLEWLAAQGFPPKGPLQVAQYLATTDDHDAEVVITLIARVPGCNDAGNPGRLDALASELSIVGD